MNSDTHKQRFEKALRREPVTGHVPQFELVFFLTMEAFGKVHSSQRFFGQWNQMSYSEKKLHIEDIAQIHIMTARKYNHDAIFVHPNPCGFDETKWLLQTIREKSGNEYFLMMHGDTTVSIPSGEDMLDFSVKMYEDLKAFMKSRKGSRKTRLKRLRRCQVPDCLTDLPCVRIMLSMSIRFFLLSCLRS